MLNACQWYIMNYDSHGCWYDIYKNFYFCLFENHGDFPLGLFHVLFYLVKEKKP